MTKQARSTRHFDDDTGVNQKTGELISIMPRPEHLKECTFTRQKRGNVWITHKGTVVVHSGYTKHTQKGVYLYCWIGGKVTRGDFYNRKSIRPHKPKKGTTYGLIDLQHNYNAR